MKAFLVTTGYPGSNNPDTMTWRVFAEDEQEAKDSVGGSYFRKIVDVEEISFEDIRVSDLSVAELLKLIGKG